jgi:enoyl-CoA hydratase/carnithine racemase
MSLFYVGPCNTPAPGMFDLVGKAKHKAWMDLGSMSKESAMEEYEKIVSKLFDGTLPAGSKAPLPVPATDSKKPGLVDVVFNRKTGQPKSTKLTTVDVNVSDSGIATISLNRPSHHNALNFQMWEDLISAFNIVEKDKSVRVAILTGTAKSFTSGMDLSVFGDMQKSFNEEKCEGRRREAIIKAVKWFQDAISSPENCSVPVIAAISGHCIGAGVDLITACDLRYCTADASFSVKEIDIGIVADIGTLQRLPKLIGDQKSRELAYTARAFNGTEAEKMGLVLQSCETHEQLMRQVTEVAATIASKSPITVRGIKKTVLYTRDHTVEDSLKQVQYHNAAHMYSSDLMEAMRATMTKEKPRFQD